MKFFKKYKIPISCIVDKNKNVYVEEVITLTFEEACQKYEKAIVVISAIAYKDEIKKSIISRKPKFIVVSFDPTLEVLQNRTYKERVEYYLQYENKLCDLENMVEDERSKVVLSNIIEGALTNNIDCYKNTSSNSQYFPHIIRSSLSEEEIFVDVGAFTGDTIRDFIKVVNNKYKKIYAFEPDLYNISIAQNDIRDQRVVFYRNGVGKTNTISYFLKEEGQGATAHIVEEKIDNVSEIESIRLDDVIEEKITYLKMDIEGMELDALMGAERLISTYKPKMAISIYHKMEDIIKIPYFIHSMNLGYKLYLRHFWNCNGTDTILFLL